MTGGIALPSAREGRHKDLQRNGPSAEQSRTDRARSKPTVNMTSLCSKLFTNRVTSALRLVLKAVSTQSQSPVMQHLVLSQAHTKVSEELTPCILVGTRFTPARK